MNISQADISLACTVAVSAMGVISLILGEIRRRGDRRMRDSDTAARSAELKAKEVAGAAVSSAELKGVEQAIQRLAVAQERLAERYHDHETECAEFRGRMESETTSTRKAIEGALSRIEHVSRQVSSLTPQAGFAGMLSPNRKAAP